MRLLDSLRFRISTLFQRARMDDELEEELRSHLQLRADDLERSGLSRVEAERRARLDFGSHQHFKEECKEAAGVTFVDSFLQDLRFALRVLRKSPSFTGVAVGTLAMAITANTVVFAALNALILRPLNVPRAESLYSIHRVSDHAANQSYPGYLDLRDRNRSFEDLAAVTIMQAGLDAGDNPARAWGFAVSGNYFDVLGVEPHLGRFFHASDERGADSAPYVVLSHACWHHRFQDDPSVVGRVIRVNKQPFTIIGVAPPGFVGTLAFFSADFFLPMVNQGQIEVASVLNARGNRWIFMTLGHLKPGVTPEQAAADMTAIGAYLEKAYPKDHAKMTFVLRRPSLYGDYLGRPVGAFLTALMLLAGLILLAACANLGSLFAARAADRSREVALRLALGAGRMRILRQLLTEALVISIVGGVLGLWGSVVLLKWVSAWNPFPQFPIHLPLGPDANVFGFSLLLAVGSGLLFGMVPVRQVLRTDPYQVIKSGSTGTSRRRITGRDALVVVQIAICAVLVTSSIVAVRGLVRTLRGDFGFDPRNTMLLSTALDMAGYRGDAVPRMHKRMIDAMGTIPAVAAVGLIDGPPLTTGGATTSLVFTDATVDPRPASAVATAYTLRISPAYFRAAGTSLLSGRDFTWQDDARTPRVAVINEEFARKVFGSATNAIGRYYKMREGARIEVVGIVEEGKYVSVTEDPEPVMFLPILQAGSSEVSLVVRSSSDPEHLAAAMRSKLRELDAGLPCYIQPWSQAMDLVLFPSRVASVALGVLGVMAAMLSITGIFGLAAYSVSKRMRELGIRIALGARRKEVLQAALGRSFKLLTFGSAAGLLLGILASRVLASIVYEATPRDPVVLAGVVLAMLMLGVLATLIPAQRALAVNPVILMRDE